MRTAIVLLFCLGAGVLGLQAQRGPKTLDIYYIDTEGGQSTLFVGPTGESLLVDTGNGGDRDLTRIVETLRPPASSASITCGRRTTTATMSGRSLALARQFPMMRFYDHGKPNANDRIVSAAIHHRVRGA